MIKMTKRDLFVGSAAAMATLPAASLSAKNFELIFESDLLSDLDVFSDLESASHVGKAYLKSVADDQDHTALRKKIMKKLAAQPAEMPLKQALAHAIAQDFANKRLVVLEGWHLAELEGQLCAFAALQKAMA